MRRTGKILYFGRRGFGHVIDDATGEHIYFHISDFTDKKRSAVEQDAAVSFEMIHPAKGPRAVKLEVIATKISETKNLETL